MILMWFRQDLFVVRDMAHISEVSSKEEGGMGYLHTTLHFITIWERTVYDFKRSTEGSDLAAGKSILHSFTRPRACILLFWLFFNLWCLIVRNKFVYTLPFSQAPHEWSMNNWVHQREREKIVCSQRNIFVFLFLKYFSERRPQNVPSVIYLSGSHWSLD